MKRHTQFLAALIGIAAAALIGCQQNQPQPQAAAMPTPTCLGSVMGPNGQCVATQYSMGVSQAPPITTLPGQAAPNMLPTTPLVGGNPNLGAPPIVKDFVKSEAPADAVAADTGTYESDGVPLPSYTGVYAAPAPQHEAYAARGPASVEPDAVSASDDSSGPPLPGSIR